jgi:hypothetical protein
MEIFHDNGRKSENESTVLGLTGKVQNNEQEDCTFMDSTLTFPFFPSATPPDQPIDNLFATLFRELLLTDSFSITSTSSFRSTAWTA